MSNQSPYNFQICTRCPHGFRKKPGTLKNVKSPGAKLRSKWRLNADDFLVLTELKLIFATRKILKKLQLKCSVENSICPPAINLNIPTSTAVYNMDKFF